MNRPNKKNTSRWVLFRHTDAPDDPKGLHFDLLIEDRDFCRSWRLNNIPILDGSFVEALQITPHKLQWLEIHKKEISGNRGLATRIKEGNYFGSLPKCESSFINLLITWDSFEVYLIIDKKGCKISTQAK